MSQPSAEDASADAHTGLARCLSVPVPSPLGASPVVGVAQRISGTESTTDCSQYDSWCYVEFENNLYKVFWPGSEVYPHLTHFPAVPNTIIQYINVSLEQASILRQSTLIAHGSDSCIRFASGPYPVLKVAHPNSESRAKIAWEHEMLMRMEHLSLPIPMVDPEPLRDQEGIYCYRMCRLTPVEHGRARDYALQVEAAVMRLHQAGFSHGDLHEGQFMLDRNQEVVLIDFSCSGPLGDFVPAHISPSTYRSPVFHSEADKKRLAYFFFSQSRQFFE